MIAKELIDALSNKLGLSTQREIARFLGMSEMALYNWQNLKKPLSPRRVVNAVISSRKAALRDFQQRTIRPIVEFFPIEPIAVGKIGKFAVFSTGSQSGQHLNGLREKLEAAKGLYIFYDTRGKALYAGQTKKQNLWKEINLAFNRDRGAQIMTLVRHPLKDVAFKPAYEKVRQPTDINLKLHDLAAYISAFEVADTMVDDLEALLVRAFPNDLLNFKMEKFGKVAKKVSATKNTKKSKKPKKAT